MESYYRPTRVEISLDALNRNLRAFRSAMPEGRLLMASVKANAYGHGAVEIAREAERFGVDYLGVAFLDEALQLRHAGIATPILVLGFVPPEALSIARDKDITIALFREDVLEAAAALPDQADGKKLKVHIKVDSGMGRLGIIGTDEAIAFIDKALDLPQLEVEGLFTHYARADEADKSYTRQQYERFRAVAEHVRGQDLPIRLIHAANSAAGIDTPEYGGDMVRLGISMYGLYPSGEVNRDGIKLDPVLSLKTEVVMVKDAPPGWGISYGTRYVTKREERIGTLPIGYADGFSRMLNVNGSAQVLVRGVKVPVLGTICMDQCMIALDGAAGDTAVEPGEEVVLIGRQGEEEVTAEDLASLLGTINYEVTCMIAARVPRVYVRDGQVTAVSNPLVLG
ncbi:alanine racemase [Paenibacillus glycanilyticus]|uniref:alanine racemase n=1 Tax=Paenibacillus glycanilyticus TaxID=126569 RepID=UPI00204054B4|nr:alanine racemase [Paenibacillus glycanilyticus]MCM3631016.1 alanine racemase [Paenibacillus glycanilyticus]